MKIILTAFNYKMTSKVMDVPEKTDWRFDMVLTAPIHAVTGFSGDKIGEIAALNTLCTFEWMGKMDMETGARIYVLSGISKV